MGRPVLRLATRMNRRTRWTAWAIAFACMVLVGSLSLVDGLGAGVGSVTSRFSTGPTVYLHGQDLLASSIDASSLTTIPTDYVLLRAHLGTLAVSNVTLSVVVASLTSVHGGNATDSFPATSGEVSIDVGLAQQIEGESGTPLGTNASVSIFGLPSQTLAIASPPSTRPALLPNTWAWVRFAFLLALDPAQAAPVQAVLTPSPLDPSLAAALGLTPLQTVGAVGFTQASISAAASALLVLAVVLVVVMGLLVFNAMALEVAQRQAEIRTLRSLGAASATVAAVYEGQAVLLATVGATVGSALGIVVAHAVVSFAPLAGLPNLVILPLPLLPVALACGLAVAAACVAGSVPALRAARLVRGVRGAKPS